MECDNIQTATLTFLQKKNNKNIIPNFEVNYVNKCVPINYMGFIRVFKSLKKYNSNITVITRYCYTECLSLKITHAADSTLGYTVPLSSLWGGSHSPQCWCQDVQICNHRFVPENTGQKTMNFNNNNIYQCWKNLRIILVYITRVEKYFTFNYVVQVLLNNGVRSVLNAYLYIIESHKVSVKLSP